MEPEQRLFRAVLNQAILDASEAPPRIKSFEEWLSQRRERKRATPESENEERAKYSSYLAAQNCLSAAHLHNQRRARTWLSTPSEDLKEVLRLADMDPGFYWRKIKRFAALGFTIDVFSTESV